MLNRMVNLITAVIDFFYPPFRRFIPRQTFHYIACGGANTVLDIFIFFISYNYILQKQVVHIGQLAVSPHIMSIILAFLVSFPTGFLLMRSVVFHDSDLGGRTQLFRYMLQVAVCLLLNYIFIKLFVEYFGLYPTIAKIITTVILVIFSYLSQRKFTFRKG